MVFTQEQSQTLENIIKDTIMKKLSSYKPETSHMPFHYRLLGRDRMALFSFVHSLNTTFGISIFEPIAKSIASFYFPVAEKQYIVGNSISEEAQSEIQQILNELTTGKDPNKINEVERIRKVCNKGKTCELKTVKVDLFVEDNDGEVHLFDLKTAKPNISNFKDFKRTLLEWIAIFLFKNPDKQIHSYIAIPYNPYEPKPYERWTLKGMLDLNKELKVGEEFWDFLGKKGTYTELLNIFEKAGMELRPKLDEYFARYHD